MAESLNADQRIQLLIGQMTIQNVCLAKEVEDLRAKLNGAAHEPVPEPEKPCM